MRGKVVEQSESKIWDSTIGGSIAIGIISLWIGSLVILLPIDLSSIHWSWVPIAILARTFIHTGLFILAHDAMHGSLLPSHPQWNDRIGSISLWLYACLPYNLCRLNHTKHHHHPAEPEDPDFHDGNHTQPWQWYLKFMREYLSLPQCTCLVSGIALVGAILLWSGYDNLNYLFPLKFLLWWILPLMLSSIQLFIFGTYLPHRHTEVSIPHRARTIDYPLFWSFLSCYHFGYHWEHHEYPHTPWYRIPAIYLKVRSLGQNMSK